MPASAITIEAYRRVAPRGAVDFLLRLAERARGRRFLHERVALTLGVSQMP